MNLFDVVRLYQGQNAGGSNKTVPESTIKEKQLIGRGVRYCPFQYQDTECNKRKFDSNLNNELRILEELFYHTYDEESRYISHLKTELKKDGYIADDKEIIEFDLKEEFKKSDFYKNVKVWKNEKINNPDKKNNTLESIKNNKDDLFEYNLTKSNLKQDSLEVKKSCIFGNARQEQIKIKDIIDRHILRNAVSKSKNLDFTKLANELEMNSIEDLLSDNFFGNFEINLTLDKEIKDINNKERLSIAINFLDWFNKKITEYSNPHKGTEEFEPLSFDKIFIEPKRKMIDKKEISQINKCENSWYILNKCYLNGNEQKCLEDIQQNFINKLEDKKEIYLLRNEEVYKIYNTHGQGFQPDFIIFIKDNDEKYYQILVEAKGKHLTGYDKWKEDFLSQLESLNDKKDFSFENIYYKLIVLPFYNKEKKEIV